MIALLPLLLLLSYGAGNIHGSTAPDNSSDMLALLDFKHAINDPGQVLSSWTPSTPLCQWAGVNCSRTHTDRVVVLNLSAIPWELNVAQGTQPLRQSLLRPLARSFPPPPIGGP